MMSGAVGSLLVGTTSEGGVTSSTTSVKLPVVVLGTPSAFGPSSLAVQVIVCGPTENVPLGGVQTIVTSLSTISVALIDSPPGKIGPNTLTIAVPVVASACTVATALGAPGIFNTGGTRSLMSTMTVTEIVVVVAPSTEHTTL